MTVNEIKVSVRELVENVLKSGDISSGFMSSSRAVEGTKAHQTVQKALKAQLPENAELFIEHQLVHSLTYKDFDIIIEGRIDSLLKEADEITVIEIKSTYAELNELSFNERHPHWAQAVFYSYIYAEQNAVDELSVRLTYYKLDSEELSSFSKKYDFASLKEYFFDLLDKYLEMFILAREWNARRDEAIKQLDFPYDRYRKGQREFVVAVYKTIREQKRLFIQAPTGTGKTMSVLFPAIKAIGEQELKRIFYLTARTTHRQAAEAAIEIMRHKGLKLKCITITAKEKVCLKEQVNCNPEYCEFAKGYYNRIDNAIKDIFINEDVLDYTTIEHYAIKHQVCPFEFTLDVSLWTECIICDYNYVFDPKVYLKRFFMEKTKKDYAVLIDEAHNLVDRAREMFSADICKSELMVLKKALRVEYKKDAILKAITNINSFMIGIKRSCVNNNCNIQSEPPKDMYPLLQEYIKLSEDWMKKNLNSEVFDKVLDFYFRVDIFLKIAELYNTNYVTYSVSDSKDTVIRLFCVDPASLLQQTMNKLKAGIFFSATLSPIGYYREILGGCEDDYTMGLNSPFDKDKLGVFVCDNVSTKYNNRADTYYSVVDIINGAICGKKGNYLVFFPSYKYMNEVYDRFSEKYPDTKSIVQNNSMNEAERAEFIDSFRIDNEETFVAFAVLGGIFSEGIDLTGDRLSGAVIVGVGLPQICIERDIIAEYFKNKNNMGYEYSYVYPGMNKVLQAAGRVIRTETDMGIIVLIDERYRNIMYKKLMPKEWSGYDNIRSSNQLTEGVEDFWKNVE